MSKPLRVLMVEDSEDDVLLTIHALKKGGYDPVYERELIEADSRTKRRQAEKDVIQAREDWENIFQAIGHPTVILDPHHGIIAANKAVLDAAGVTRKELLGKKCYEIFHGKDYASPPEGCPMESLLASGQAETVNKEMEALGGVFLVSCTPIRNKLGQVEKIIHITTDITDRKQAEGKLKQTLDSLKMAIGATVQVLVSAVETRDPYTAGHQNRSADLARAMATEMGLSQERIDGIRMAGSIHDIGKLSVPAEILSKPTKLTELEFAIIKEHSNKGFEMLKDVESSWPLAEIVYQHHERMDGSGYPRKLKGEEILMEARILAVADVVESMASHRPYRPALGLNAAMAEIDNNKGTLYDADVVDVCLKLFREKGYKLKGTRF